MLKWFLIVSTFPVIVTLLVVVDVLFPKLGIQKDADRAMRFW